MSTITATEQTVPTGTWTLDRTHSSVTYSVRHSGVSLFKGGLTDFEATFDDGRLYGSADVARLRQSRRPRGPSRMSSSR